MLLDVRLIEAPSRSLNATNVHLHHNSSDLVRQFLSLQEQLSKTEDEISFARRFFNGAVREYNTAIKSFPSNLLAAPMGFKEAQFFEIEPVDRLLPGVGLGPDQ